MKGVSRLRPPPALVAIVFAVVIGGALVLVSGANPIQAYAAIVGGALAPDNLPNTLNWATPLVGMTLAAAIPLRGGMINLANLTDGLIPNPTDDLIAKPADDLIAHIRRREEEGLPPGGFGLLLAKGTVDELLYNEIGNEVLLIKYIDRAPSSQNDPLVH